MVSGDDIKGAMADYRPVCKYPAVDKHRPTEKEDPGPRTESKSHDSARTEDVATGGEMPARQQPDSPHRRIFT